MADPLEILKPHENRNRSYIYDIWAPICGGTLGFLIVSFVNYGTRRPWFSGIQKHIAASVGAAAAFQFMDKKRNEYLAEKDAVLRHYVELHPEDFVTEARKKYGEIFEPWIPVR